MPPVFEFFFFFFDNVTGDLLEFKQQITGQISDDGTKIIKIKVSLKYVSNFWRTLEMPLIYCEINLTVTWSANCVISLGTAGN